LGEDVLTGKRAPAAKAKFDEQPAAARFYPDLYAAETAGKK
jgi:hypothetical protein